MAMSTGDSSGGPMSEINVTPLVDVMLVLLIIFMITAPLMSHRITVDLPTANPKTADNEFVEPMDLAVKPDGTMYLNDVEVTEAELKAQFAVAAAKSPQPELQIRADKTTEYKVVKKILASAKEQGMVHVGFITTGKE
ncbi:MULTISPECIES: ExbD/TolR family protein [Dyella]|uniref:Biopolymer transporter ExbD n=2 Tax=Dyella TaxID=231454 RepID=A0A4R0YQ94_9GAMM|nr:MULTISPECIES: biopolymer transporter ExbD [Dyella]TBR35866.1 biopolymer transporter ExbD [Dyella terrae]TCI08586.1 biopolymer transporter ExbD [Dyella soli]